MTRFCRVQKSTRAAFGCLLTRRGTGEYVQTGSIVCVAKPDFHSCFPSALRQPPGVEASVCVGSVASISARGLADVTDGKPYVCSLDKDANGFSRQSGWIGQSRAIILLPPSLLLKILS